MSELEYCWKCDAPTGNAGRYEDSLYDVEDGGPYCEECWDKLEPLYAGRVMNSREKVTAFRNKWLPEVGYDFQMEMVKMLDQHAEEARVDQGEACACKCKAVKRQAV